MYLFISILSDAPDRGPVCLYELQIEYIFAYILASKFERINLNFVEYTF